jgi:tetratricopeptide (TPR) repeat protein
VAAQARIATLAAADRAISLHSHRQAISYLEQALTVTHEAAQRAAIHERIILSCEYAGALELSSEHGRAAMGAYDEAGDPVGRLRAATAMSHNLIGFHLEDEAADALRATIEEARPLGEVPELAGAYAELARATMLRDRHQEAIDAADQALRMGGVASPQTLVEALVTKGTSMTTTPRTIEAEAILRGAIHLADEMGLIGTGLRARNNLSGPLGYRDQGEARRMIREGYEIASRYGHRPFGYQFLYAALEIDLRLGKWDDGIAELDAIEENETLFPFYRISFLGMRAVREALRGDLASAEQKLRLADQTLPELQSMQGEAYLHLVWASVLFLAGRMDEAVAHGQVAAANSNFNYDASWITANAAAAADLRRALAEATDGMVSAASFPGPGRDALYAGAGAALAAREGRWGEAHAGFAAAIKQLTEQGLLYYASLAGLLWDSLSAGRDSDATEAGRVAAEFFAERQASSFVERYRAGFVPVQAQQAAEPAGVETLTEA